MTMEKSFIAEMFGRIDARDWEGLKSFFCPDVTYERPGYEMIRGLPSLLDFYQNVRIIASGRHSLTQIVVADESGACWGSFAGLHRNGADLGVRFADCYTFQDGKIKTRISYFFQPAV
jgi:uncharacterized protein